MENDRATPSNEFLLRMKADCKQCTLDEEGLIEEASFLATRKVFHNYHE